MNKIVKYTIAVNAHEYLYGIYETKEEAGRALVDLMYRQNPEMLAHYRKYHPKDEYYKDEPFTMFVEDMAGEMNDYNIMELQGV